MATTRDIAQRAYDLGLSACACTDHDVVAGHLDFYGMLTEKPKPGDTPRPWVGEIKPILGVETYQSPISRKENYKALRNKETGMRQDNFHLILLAMNDKGLQNLWAMNTEAHRSGFYYNARVDWELLEKYNEGIIATSACGLGMLGQAVQDNPHVQTDANDLLTRYLSIFGDRFYIELHTYPEVWQHEININASSLAKERGVPVVYANDAHYAFPHQYDLHEAVIALQVGKKLSDPPEQRMSHQPALFIMEESQTREHLNHLPKSIVDEAIKNSDVIAERCNVDLPARRKRIPTFVPDKGYATSRDQLFDLVEQGYNKKIVAYGKEKDDIYFNRIAKEIEVIFSANLVDYFLMVRDYVYWAKMQGIMVGPGRGSVGGSLVAYLIGITEVDPIRYGLIFERFYNAGREKSLPDIDIDFPQAGRELVKEYLTKKFGVEYVADLGTINRLKSKNGINDMGRVMGIPRRDTEMISKILDNTIDAGLQAKWPEILEEVGEQLAPYMDKYPQLFEWAQELYDHIRTYGIHPSGVIVGDEPLAYTFPLRYVSKYSKLVTQFDMRDADKYGYIKADLLGLRNLDTLTETNEILKERGKKPLEFDPLQYQELPEEMWQLLDNGLSVGIFQVEDGGMAKQIAKAMKPRSVDDLAVLVAMNRPGPLRSGAFDRYMRWRETGEIDVPHPLVGKVTETTGGVFLFQEQVIQFMTEIGYSLEEADDVRAIMGKKKVDQLEIEYPRYIGYASQHMAEPLAKEIWNDLLNFAKYGFNKSHAVEYGLITLWTLYAKWAAPHEFILASIRTVRKDQIPRYVQEAQRMRIRVIAPSINRSMAQTTLDGDDIIFGFEDIKGFGSQVANWIVKHRPFENADELESKSMDPDFKYILPNGQRRMVVNLGHIDKLLALDAWEDNPQPEKKRIEIEEELLGVALSDNSAKILEDNIDVINEYCVPFAATNEPGEYAIAGIIKDISTAKTKKGTNYARVKIVNDADEETVYVWNEELKRLAFIWQHRQAGIFNVKRNNHGLSLLDAIVLYPKKESKWQ